MNSIIPRLTYDSYAAFHPVYAKGGGNTLAVP